MKAHRIAYEEVGLLVPWWKIAIGLPAEALGWWRLRDRCLTYEVRRVLESTESKVGG